MKKTLLLLFMLAGFYAAKAQVTLYSTDFESDTVGKFALQAGAPWTTWTNTPGGTEDPSISTTQAHSGTKSVNVLNANDLVLNIYDKTHGRFMVQWYMYVESGKLGYFNFLSDFAGSTSLWALEVFIRNDSIFINADGTNKATGVFTSNTWKKMQVIVDLDDDFATFYIDGTEMISYPWSKGSQGTNNSKKLDGIDFYGWDNSGAGTSGYYLDDLEIDSVPAPPSPSNLTATLNVNDIDVAWTASTPNPDIYKLSRNGEIVDATNSLAYTDLAPWPNKYVYAVRSHYVGEGYSHASNKDSVTIAGGVTRNLVLMEEATGTWCQYCPGAAMGLRDLIETNHKIATAIAYHSGDTYEITASTDRIGYYNVTGFPTVIGDGNGDGTSRVDGGNATTSMYPSYLPIYNKRIACPAFDNLDLTIVQTATDTYTATVVAEETFTAFSPVKLYAALTESNIAESWGNQTEVDFVCRGMYPSSVGTGINFATQNPQTFNLNFTTTGFVKNNCEFVVFIQDDASHEITQVAKVDMSTVLGIQELSGEKISIYPNPASEYFMANTSGKGMIEIYDMTGKLISSTNITKTSQAVDIRNLRSGIYFVKVTNEKNSFTQKLVVE